MTGPDPKDQETPPRKGETWDHISLDETWDVRSAGPKVVTLVGPRPHQGTLRIPTAAFMERASREGGWVRVDAA